jgi:ribosomal protein S18 acetylase RimI-like enzyme
VLAKADAARARISLSEDALAEAGADVLLLDVGRVIRQPACPHVYDANLVRRARLRPPGLDDALERLAAPLRQIGARHLQLTLDGSDVPEEVGPLLRQRGFQRDRLVAMVLDGSPDGEGAADVSLAAVPAEASWAVFAEGMDRVNRDEAWYAPAVSLEIVGSLRRRCEAGGAAVFVGLKADRPVGTIGLAIHRGCASIFSVGTFLDARRRGIGRALIQAAIARARAAAADLIYLIARADDSPRAIYERIGFRVELGFDVWLRA